VNKYEARAYKAKEMLLSKIITSGVVLSELEKFILEDALGDYFYSTNYNYKFLALSDEYEK